MAKFFVLITAGSALCGDVHAELDMTSRMSALWRI
jgi:hypothetical protein